MSGKALFLMCHVGSIRLMNSSHAQFGILPIPKLTDSQMEYGNTIQYANATCYVIPRTTLDPDFSGFMLEAMGYFSSPDAFESTDGVGSLRYAYYESLLKRNGGSERDDDSWDMLGLIFDNRTFDIGFALNNSLCNHVYSATTAGYNWSSLMSRELNMIERDLKEKLRY